LAAIKAHSLHIRFVFREISQTLFMSIGMKEVCWRERQKSLSYQLAQIFAVKQHKSQSRFQKVFFSEPFSLFMFRALPSLKPILMFGARWARKVKYSNAFCVLVCTRIDSK
jgi:hypothetical protein